MKKIKLLVPLMGITALSACAIPLVGCGTKPQPEPEAKDFNTDPWSTIIYYANKGGDTLAKAYGYDDASELIGKTREVTLTQDDTGEDVELTYKVRVIGVDHDSVSDTTKAALTFQFIDLISDSQYEEFIWLPYSSEYSNVWSSSDLRVFANGKLLSWFPEEVATGLKSVSKTTVVSSQDGSAQPTSETTNDKIFVPSLVEVYGEDAIDNSKYAFSELDKEWYFKEGTQYEFFADKLDLEDPYDPETSLLKKGLGEYSDFEDYWLRTPTMSPEGGDYPWLYTWNITDGGSAMEVNTGDTEESSIAPCFCI
ncbi:MAG: hypothetical protein KBS35_01205 [Mycoplasma sp.]|nr:hypothetical protein [Candidatus Hennigella equi]